MSLTAKYPPGKFVTNFACGNFKRGINSWVNYQFITPVYPSNNSKDLLLSSRIQRMTSTHLLMRLSRQALVILWEGNNFSFWVSSVSICSYYSPAIPKIWQKFRETICAILITDIPNHEQIQCDKKEPPLQGGMRGIANMELNNRALILFFV